MLLLYSSLVDRSRQMGYVYGDNDRRSTSMFGTNNLFLSEMIFPIAYIRLPDYIHGKFILTIRTGEKYQ